MSNEPKPPVRLVSRRHGALWTANSMVLDAARECAAEHRRGAVSSLDTLVAAIERYDAVFAGEPVEDLGYDDDDDDA